MIKKIVLFLTGVIFSTIVLAAVPYNRGSQDLSALSVGDHATSLLISIPLLRVPRTAVLEGNVKENNTLETGLDDSSKYFIAAPEIGLWFPILKSGTWLLNGLVSANWIPGSGSIETFGDNPDKKQMVLYTDMVNLITGVSIKKYVTPYVFGTLTGGIGVNYFHAQAVWHRSRPDGDNNGMGDGHLIRSVGTVSLGIGSALPNQFGEIMLSLRHTNILRNVRDFRLTSVADDRPYGIIAPPSSWNSVVISFIKRLG